jgi:hypothetical protein
VAALNALAEFTDYDGLRKALNACRELRDISFEQMDELTGAPAGWFAKVLGPRPVKRIGMQSLGWALGGLGVKCVIVSDPEALKRVEARFVERDPRSGFAQRSGSIQITLSRRHMAIIQAKGRRNRWAKMTPRQKTLWGKKMRKLRTRKEAARRARQRKATHKARARADRSGVTTVSVPPANPSRRTNLQTVALIGVTALRAPKASPDKPAVRRAIPAPNA